MGQNVMLLIASLIFYAWGEPKYVLIMIASIIVNYALGLLVDKVRHRKVLSRLVIALTAVLNLSVLFIFKYLMFTVDNINSIAGLNLSVPNIALPIGISFFTFQAMSYVIDVYREKGEAQKNPLNVGLYISFFPQLIAGPIVRYETVAYQIKHRVETFDNFSTGVVRFIIGLAKKVLLANTMGVVADYSFDMPNSELTVVMAWIGAIAYSLQIFFDFSGYSDMAIGLGKMFGFDFLENFDYPYISKSITEFWRRWHISLGAWLKEYVFYPVSLSGHFKKVNTFTKKHIKSQHIVGFITIAYTLFFVWFCNGLWHGASWLYIVYGLYYYVLMMLGKFTEPYTDKLAKKLHINKESKGYSVFQVARTVVIVNVGMLLFRSSTLVEFGKLFGKMFTSINFMDFCSIIKIQDGIILAVGFVVMLLVGIIKEKGIDIRMWLIEHNFVIRWLVYYFLLFSTIILGAYGIGYGGAAAIYAQF